MTSFKVFYIFFSYSCTPQLPGGGGLLKLKLPQDGNQLKAAGPLKELGLEGHVAVLPGQAEKSNEYHN